MVALCFGNRDKLRPDGPLGLYIDFTFMGPQLLIKSIIAFVASPGDAWLLSRGLCLTTVDIYLLMYTRVTKFTVVFHSCLHACH